MRISSVDDKKISLSMVYHNRTDEDSGVSTSNSTGLKSEHIFAFVWGFGSLSINGLLTFPSSEVHDLSSDHSRLSARITPDQILAGMLYEHHVIISQELAIISQNLDKNVEDMTEGLFIEENRKLLDIRSTIHRLDGVIDAMINTFTPFQTSVEEWLQEVTDPRSVQVMSEVKRLDICRKRTRDKVKFAKTRQSIQEDRVESQHLQERINLGISRVGFCLETFAVFTNKDFSNLCYVGTEFE
jgi:hypothetical protein